MFSSRNLFRSGISVFDGVVESLTQLICSEIHIHSGMNYCCRHVCIGGKKTVCDIVNLILNYHSLKFCV